MYRLFVFTFVIAAVTCQYDGAGRVPKYAGDPKTAAIVQEARYLSGNGAFGAAYQQEDGINFKEETDAEGNRKGSYSYIDPSGQRKTVNYIAGKNGFQAVGDHIPTAPQAAAPTPGYTPDPRYNSPDYKAPQQYSAPQQYTAPAAPRNYGGKPNQDDGQYYPELYEKENYAAPQQQYQPQPQQYQQQSYQQPQQSYQQPQQSYQQPQQSYQQPQQSYQTNNIYPGTQQAEYSGLQSEQYNAPVQSQGRQQYYEPTTPPPSHFFPPGKFSLNRAPDGYTYSFQKV